MTRSVPQALREKLTSDTLLQLSRDRSRSSNSKIVAFLDYISERIFDANISVGQVYKACDIERRSFVPMFIGITGERPKDYIQNLRLEAGEKLLRTTALRLTVIAELVGFSSGSAFSEAFTKAFKERPIEYRSRIKSKTEVGILDAKLWKSIRSGEFDSEEANLLLNYIQEHHPNIQEQTPDIQFHFGEESFTPTTHFISTQTLEKLKAQNVWLKLRSLPINEQRNMISKAEVFETPALFELLKEKILVIGRKDRQEALNVAVLALDAAQSTERLDLYGRSALWSQAYACMGNAQRLALELRDAQRSFRLAKEFLPANPTPTAHGELLFLEAALRWYERQPKAGLELVNHSIALLQEKGRNQILLAKALIHRGILRFCLGEFSSAIKDHTRACKILVNQDRPELSCGALYNVALCLFELNKHDRALEILEGLRAENEKIDSRQFALLADWLEGRISLERGQLCRAESLLEASHKGFSVVRSKVAALVGIDLAIVYLLKKRPRKALLLARAAIPVLSLWKDQSSFSKPFKELERAIRAKEIDLDNLTEIRDLTQVMLKDPIARRDLQFTGVL